MQNSIEEQYRGLLGSLLHNSNTKSDRTGTGTLSIFGRQIRHSMSDGFPLLTTKKMAVKTMMTELKWFLRGDTNIKFLVDNNCNIWNGDAYKKYHEAFPETEMLSQEQFINLIKTDDEFAKKWGDLGPIYGKQWRDWDGRQKRDGSYDMSLDQIANLIFQLKRNPDSRRLMVSAWNVGELSEMTLPPCHYGFQCYVSDLSPLEIIDQAKKDGLWKDTIPEGMTLSELQKDFKTKKLSLMWNQRSVDTFLGLPFNIASYATLLCLIAEEVGMIPDQLIGNLGDVHLYSNHVDQATEQLSREIYALPTLEFSNVNLLDGEFDFEVKDYKYHPSIKAPISN
jgi:thymidylate synthase